jgi:hypothetical protein
MPSGTPSPYCAAIRAAAAARRQFQTILYKLNAMIILLDASA